jgi:hypothetical protein
VPTSGLPAEGLTHPIIARLADALTARSVACREILHPA